VAIKRMFVKALLLCCASLGSQFPGVAQELSSPTPEEINDDSELIAGVRPGTRPKVSMNVVRIGAGPDRSPVPEPVPPPAPVAVSAKVKGGRSLLERAYLDAFEILASANKCSDLLGGSRSIAALNDLVAQLGTKNLPPSVAMQMSGPPTTYQSHLTGFTYRIFKKAELNVNGLFFRSNFMNQPRVPTIGGFQPNTREARVTVLLHELGHLVKGTNKRWLLPDDGDDEILSLANTERILDACRESIKQVAGSR
jgi:hypothetical protein